MAPTPLAVECLTKSYGALQAVKALSLGLNEGETLGILGPNGAGKTTIVSMMAGLLPRDSGTISFKDRDIGEDLLAFKSRVGLVPQELALYPTLSARENLRFFGRIYRLKGKDLDSRVEEELDRVGLLPRAGDAIDTYSTGMKRRVNLAAGLLHRPEILFLDEPTVGVDPQARNAIFEGIEALKARGVSIVYTTHYMEEAERLCDRVAIVDEGRLIALDTPKNLIQTRGHEVIRLGVAGNDHGAIASELGRLASVQAVELGNGEISVELRDAQRNLLEVLSLVQKRGTDITSIRLLAPNLETAFLKLTGKALRD